MIIKPEQPLSGYQLVSELRTAGLTSLPVNGVTLTYQGIRIMAEDTPANDTIVTDTLAVHVPDPGFDLTAHLAEEQALRFS